MPGIDQEVSTLARCLVFHGSSRRYILSGQPPHAPPTFLPTQNNTRTWRPDAIYPGKTITFFRDRARSRQVASRRALPFGLGNTDAKGGEKKSCSLVTFALTVSSVCYDSVIASSTDDCCRSLKYHTSYYGNHHLLALKLFSFSLFSCVSLNFTNPAVLHRGHASCGAPNLRKRLRPILTVLGVTTVS